MRKTLGGHRSGTRALAFSGDGKVLASSNFGSDQITLWDVAKGETWLNLEGHQGDVDTLAFGGNGGLLASGSADKTVKVSRPRPPAGSAVRSPDTPRSYGLLGCRFARRQNVVFGQ